MLITRRDLLNGLSVVAAGSALSLARGPGAAAAQPMRARLISESPLEEPFMLQLHLAMKRLKDEYGLDYEMSESVKAADYIRVLRDWADQGIELIVGDAYSAEDGCRRVARDFPETAFVMASAVSDVADNFSIYPGQNYEPCYLAGMLAAKLSKTGTIGIVAGFAVPATNVVINTYRDGARSINPAVKVKISFIGSWYDPPKAKEATIAQVEQGVDVIIAERVGVIEAAAERGIVAFGYMSDQAAVKPDTVVTSIIWDPYPLVKESIDRIKAGTFKGQDMSPFELMSKGGSYLTPYGAFEDRIPIDTKAEIEAKSKDIISGVFVIKYDGSEPKSD